LGEQQIASENCSLAVHFDLAAAPRRIAMEEWAETREMLNKRVENDLSAALFKPHVKLQSLTRMILKKRKFAASAYYTLPIFLSNDKIPSIDAIPI
jgi:hypothetical protein